MRRVLFSICLVMALVGAWLLPVNIARGAESEAVAPAATDAKPVTKPETDKESVGEDSGKKKIDDVSGGRFAGDPVYVHIAPMVMPIITDQGVEQLVTIIIDVEVKDFDTADNMHTNMPKVQDALMRALYGGLGQGSLRDGKLVNVDRIKSKATAALTNVIGDGVQEVLIQGIAQRML